MGGREIRSRGVRSGWNQQGVANHLILKDGVQQKAGLLASELVRIEIAPGELPKALDPQIFKRIFKKLGYKYVTLDLEGYRTGSLNEVL